MLLFDDSKKLEKAIGEEAAAVIAHVFERADEKWRQELATKADLQEAISATRGDVHTLRTEMIERIADTKHEILKWMLGIAVAQPAMLVAVLAVMR